MAWPPETHSSSVSDEHLLSIDNKGKTPEKYEKSLKIIDRAQDLS
jgi:hypothetical protein